MTEIASRSAKGKAVVRWFFAAAFILALVLSGVFSGLMNRAGLFFLLGGSVAVAFMGFTGREIGTAFRQAAGQDGDEKSLGRSAYFWEAAASNAWILGALGSALSFTVTLSSDSGGIAEVGNRMIQSLIVALYGLVLAVIFLAPAMKLADKAGKARLTGERQSVAGDGPSAHLSSRKLTPGRFVGYVLFAAVLVRTIIVLAGGRPQDGPMPMAKILLHWPAILVVLGGTIALALFTGAGSGARAWTLGFGVTGLVALLMGLIQALFGFAHANLAEISSAVAFIISASSLSLFGLVAVAAPLEDREVMEGCRAGPGPFSRMFWVLLPLLTFIFLVLTFIMVVTPITKPG
jgi:hypothetical protein